MENDHITQLLNALGQILSEDNAYPSDDTLLHAQVDTNWVSASVFKDRGNDLLYRDPDLRLTETLLDLWEEWESDKRWAEIEYVVRDGKFDASFVYAEDIDFEEDEFERRDRIVARHFGNKPIVYPPFPNDDRPEF